MNAAITAARVLCVRRSATLFISDTTVTLSSIGRSSRSVQWIGAQICYVADMHPSFPEHRGLPAAFGLCALATLTLLANHPANKGALIEILADQARHRFAAGLVHGGFMVVLAVLIVCFVLLSQVLGAQRIGVVTGLVAFGLGCTALMASLVLDGFAVPAIATRFAPFSAAEDLGTARVLVIFCETLIRLLMPMGLLFQSAAMISWSTVLVGRRGWRLLAGGFGQAAGAALILSILLLPPAFTPHIVVIGIVLQSLWYLGIAGLLAAGGAPAPHSLA